MNKQQEQEVIDYLKNYFCSKFPLIEIPHNWHTGRREPGKIQQTKQDR